jgi:hypothetical protein
METDLKYIKRLSLIFIILLVLSGITAFPLISEINFMMKNRSLFPPLFQTWIGHLYDSIHNTPVVMLYGTDWLAFAHLVIALFFIGVYRDPVKHKFNVVIGMIACAGVLPLAFIMGPQRDIPFFHQLIDCSFGILGFVPLWLIYKKIKHIEHEHTSITL